MAEETIWSFGYGSNMDVKALEAKKHVKVIGKYLSISSRIQDHYQQFFFGLEHTLECLIIV